MAKRRLTEQQIRRIEAQHERRRQRASDSDPQSKASAQNDLGPGQEGLVLANLGKMVDVEAFDKTIYRCKIRQNLGDLVCGDRVVFHASAPENGIVSARHKRRTILGRADKTNTIKPVAANIDQMIIVAASVPKMVTSLLDSYCVAAENLNIRPTIVFNKIDLLTPAELKKMKTFFATYTQLEYEVIYTDCLQQSGLVQVRKILAEKTSVFVGQSGVGKSSLIGQFLPEEEIKTGEVSAYKGQGTHTTTTTRLYHLQSGGNLIDSPGIREFGLWHMSPAEIAYGFIEFREYVPQCKFRNCRHQQEPACAVREACAQGKISPARLDSYEKLLVK